MSTRDALPAGPRLWAAAVLAGVAALYVWTLFPGVGGRVNVGDSAKFQYIGEILGVPHQPGYPQYVLLNHLWTRLPLPLELADKVNLLSAVLAIAAGAFFFVAARAVTRGTGPALVAMVSLLLGRTVWTFATEAEVYSLNLLYLCAVLWAAVRWRQTRSAGWLYLLMALYGLSFGNHLLMITIAPALTFLVLRTDWRLALRPRTLLFGVAVIAALAAQYGFLVLRSHSDVEVVEGIVREAEWTDVVDTITGRRFTEQHLLRKGWAELGTRLAGFPLAAARELSVVTVLLSLLGLGALWREERVLAWAALLWLGGALGFASVYQIGDWESYLIPCWVLLALLAALGATRALTRPRGRVLIALWVVSVAGWSLFNVGELRVRQNRWDRSLLLAATEAGGVAVTYIGPGYRSQELNRYYRLGLGMEESGGYEIQTAVETLEERFTHLGARRHFFRGKRVKELFDTHRVDYAMRWHADDLDTGYFVTGTRFPVGGVQLGRDESGALTVSRETGETLGSAAEGVTALVVGRAERRIKDFSRFGIDELLEMRRPRPDREPELAFAVYLEAVLPDDWLLVVLDLGGLDAGDPRVLPVLSALGAAPELAAGDDELVLYGVKGEGLRPLAASGLLADGGIRLEIPR